MIRKLILFTPLMALSMLTSCSEPDEKSGSNKSKSISVRYLVIKEDTFNTTYTTNGNILPFEEITVRSEITGRVQSIHFKEGQHIKKGQLIISLDARELEADLEKTMVLLRQSKIDLDRRKSLLESKAISQEEFDQFSNRHEELLATKSQLTARMDAYQVRAPFDGTVGLRYISEGAMVSVGDIFTNIAVQNPLKIEFAIPEKYAQVVSVGDRLRFNVRNLSDTLEALIYAKDSRIQQDSRALRVRAQFDNSDGRITPGGFASIEYQLQVHDKAILIPTDAIISQNDGEYVIRINGGISQKVKISTTERTSTSALVSSGLQKNDTIALTGLLYLRDGIPVDLQEK
ncbi:MAG: efflux RND transporter periplasmic adaptor subunit [Flavobacteriales bacterium]|nr:MAG: efflux RND transporter periplasmic adaptor subunit [Flavobacteriales bacterium]